MKSPGFLSKIAGKVLDLEHGQATADTNIPGTSGYRDPQVVQALTEFRHYLGIVNDPELAGGNGRKPNMGIYQRVCKQEEGYKKSYNWFSWLINSALGLQIIFAAALTALGAGNGPRSAVTAFGALNTIIAGFLTYLKGSGLPNRFKYYKEELTKVREYIEQREREFSRGDINVDIRAECATIADMYEAVRRDIEVNTPEAFVSRTKESGIGRGNGSVDHLTSLSSRARNQYDDRMSYYDEKAQSTRRGLESRFSNGILGAEAKFREVTDLKSGLESRLRDGRAGIEDRITQGRAGLESRLSQERLGAESRLSDTRSGLESQYLASRANIESQIGATRSNIEGQIGAARSNVEGQVNTARLATASQVENTRHGLESRIEETRSGVSSQVEETRHGMETRMKEVQAQVKEQEDKIMGMAEKIAEKVLSVTQARHENQDEKK